MEKADLTAALSEHLAKARAGSSGRSAQTLFGGHAKTLRQTLIALKGGQRLDDHENPGEATLQVLAGRVRLTTGADVLEGQEGNLLVIPDARHSLEALQDSAVLLTVAKLS